MDSKLNKLKEVFEATLLAEDKKLSTALRISPLVSYLGEEYARDYTKRRETAGIHLQSLRFSDQIAPETSKPLKETRYNAKISPKYSLVIWKDNVVEVSDQPQVISWKQGSEPYQETLKWFETAWQEAA